MDADNNLFERGRRLKIGSPSGFQDDVMKIRNILNSPGPGVERVTQDGESDSNSFNNTPTDVGHMSGGRVPVTDIATHHGEDPEMIMLDNGRGACDACALEKTRCVHILIGSTNSGQEEMCMRCYNSGQDCSWSLPKWRCDACSDPKTGSSVCEWFHLKGSYACRRCLDAGQICTRKKELEWPQRNEFAQHFNLPIRSLPPAQHMQALRGPVQVVYVPQYRVPCSPCMRQNLTCRQILVNSVETCESCYTDGFAVKAVPWGGRNSQGDCKWGLPKSKCLACHRMYKSRLPCKWVKVQGSYECESCQTAGTQCVVRRMNTREEPDRNLMTGTKRYISIVSGVNN